MPEKTTATCFQVFGAMAGPSSVWVVVPSVMVKRSVPAALLGVSHIMRFAPSPNDQTRWSAAPPFHFIHTAKALSLKSFTEWCSSTYWLTPSSGSTRPPRVGATVSIATRAPFIRKP